ncbi:cyclic dof factor 1-like [Chenopodium quinoa]|uniref:cyclic dof factor 1-like n=1 Tax=Chenopodium quinoa TaxID=63459 RepID=UPI000B793AEF|nr:cyclic dof factor 1-like [Chenopodium quinoa]
MVIEDKVSSPGTINIPENTFTNESSGDEKGVLSLEYPEVISSAQQYTEAADIIPEASKAASMIELDKPVSCPRCNSMETKFCYFNNSNINKSRHFCWSCQRYWTIGGAIKNLPIRSGQCKSKHASSRPLPLTTPSDKLAIEEPGKLSETFSIAYRERTRLVSSSCSLMRNNKVQHTMQGPPETPYPSNFDWNDEALPVPWNSPTVGLIPGVCIPNFTNSSSLSNSAENSGCSGYTSPPCFRKHSRDLNSQDEEKNDKCLTKTLRIVIDPEEAARSSIRSTLGIKSGKADSIRNGYMFRAFQFRPEENAEILEVERALEANPVALSRSQRYREST